MLCSSRFSPGLVAPLALAAAFLFAAPAAAVDGVVILADGDTPTGAAGAVTTLRTPFVNGLGHVGFIGIAGGDNFVWVNNAVVFTAATETNYTLTTGDTDGMGLSDAGGWVFGPHLDADDSVYTNGGVQVLELDAATGLTNTFFASLDSLNSFIGLINDTT